MKEKPEPRLVAHLGDVGASLEPLPGHGVGPNEHASLQVGAAAENQSSPKRLSLLPCWAVAIALWLFPAGAFLGGGIFEFGALVIGMVLAVPGSFAVRTGLEAYLERVGAAPEGPPSWIEAHLPLKGKWLQSLLYAPGALLLIFGIWLGVLAALAFPLILLVVTLRML